MAVSSDLNSVIIEGVVESIENHLVHVKTWKRISEQFGEFNRFRIKVSDEQMKLITSMPEGCKLRAVGWLSECDANECAIIADHVEAKRCPDSRSALSRVAMHPITL